MTYTVVSKGSQAREAANRFFETDWLGSTPIFYNDKTAAVSTDIWEVMPPGNELVFHPEGLYNYLDFGYSVFGQTPVEPVRFLPPASRLILSEKDCLKVEQDANPIEKWWDYHLSEDDVIELIRARVQAWEDSLPPKQEIVLPLSGGFDSRLLLWCLRHKSRVRAYTYGLSKDQNRSTEVVHARALAEQFGIRWERIPMGDQHRFFSEWDAAFGISTHAHGMYHFEFYTKIREKLPGEQAFLSGIFGDVWAGSIPPCHLNGPNELVHLGYTHGLRADPSQMRLAATHHLRTQFWTDYGEHLNGHRFQIVTTVRLKLMLISYLMRIPRLFNFKPWTPYLDIDIAMAMLNLPPKRRINRQWQHDFFVKVGLDLENQILKSDHTNSLNYQAMKRYPVSLLNKELLSGLIDPDYIEWINHNVTLSPFAELRSNLLRVPKIGSALHRLGLREKNLQAYYAYLCLKPIENIVLKTAD